VGIHENEDIYRPLLICKLKDEKMPSGLSVIIPSLNEDRLLEKTVSNINHTIGIKEYEIIIVNSGGTETSAIRKLPLVQVHDTLRQGIPQARNYGASRSSYDALLFADAHLKFEAGWGDKILRDLEMKKKA
jgi:glycosyltransferase involved in cell wall biosynthesis